MVARAAAAVEDTVAAAEEDTPTGTTADMAMALKLATMIVALLPTGKHENQAPMRAYVYHHFSLHTYTHLPFRVIS